jgi:hypothetical protein
MCFQIVVDTWQPIGHVPLTTWARDLVNSRFVNLGSLAFVDLKGGCHFVKWFLDYVSGLLLQQPGDVVDGAIDKAGILCGLLCLLVDMALGMLCPGGNCHWLEEHAWRVVQQLDWACQTYGSDC